jgi:hypothetical protein
MLGAIPVVLQALTMFFPVPRQFTADLLGKPVISGFSGIEEPFHYVVEAIRQLFAVVL